MRIFADENVPDEYVSTFRGDGHDTVYSRDVAQLGREATDAEFVAYAESEDLAILSTDAKDFVDREADVPIFVALQDMTGGDVRVVVSRIESLPFEPSETERARSPGYLDRS